MFKDEGDFHASAFILGPDATTVLIRDQRNPNPLWKFAGGKRQRIKPLGKKWRDEMPLQTLVREVHEETGLWIRKKETELVISVSMGHYNKHYFFSSMPSFSKLVALSAEYEEAKVFQVEELRWLPNFHSLYRDIYLQHMLPRLEQVA